MNFGKLFTAPILSAVLLSSFVAPAEADFILPDFSNTTSLQLNGNAKSVSSALQLTDASGYSSGSAFTKSTVSLGNSSSFSTYFQFQILASGGLGDEDGPGADGLVFVVQTVANNVGGSGSGIGYSGISKSIGIEFDTYNNGGGDPNGNHVGIDLNGSTNSTATALEATRFNNGAIWNVWVDFNGGTNGLEVRWSQTTIRPTFSQLSRTVDLVAILGQQTAFVGFTSATGGGYGNHNILQWEFRGALAPIPESSSFLLFAFGGILLIARFRALGEKRGEA